MEQRKLRHLLSILLLFLIFFICVFPVSAANDDVRIRIIDGKGIFIETHGEWQFSQGYLFVVKDVDDDGNVWVELSLDGVALKDEILGEGSVFTYSHNNSKEIFNITVDAIYYGPDGELITFTPVYQYLDPSLPAPVLEGPDSSPTIPIIPVENNSTAENVPGFSFVMAVLSMACFVIFKRFS